MTNPLQTWTTGSPALPYAPGITDGDKYAEVEIGPAVARVENRKVWRLRPPVRWMVLRWKESM